ncbi:zonular occludens toxin domain-containing protein [Pseudomonas sp. Pseusp122]|uniref:zonular occludens toxin domain-containing protein n=1 Tax=unclassified Pseudomonas TaxID=196821 RepID=UPI0039A55ACD
MLFLRTGLPGAGKTLNTIKEIDNEHAADPNDPTRRLHKDPHEPDLPPRTIYYHGIPDLKVDQLKSKWVEFDTPDTWFELPDGCVIVIDEAQGTFGTDVRTRVEKVTRFEKHRHHGWDVHIITQHPSLICSPVRKLVGKHINFIRPYGRTKGVFRHEYEMCVDSPERRTNFKMAQESKIEFDSHYFGLYKSATVHTHKKVTPSFVKLIPLLVLAVILPLALLGGGAYWFIHKKQAESEALHSQPSKPGSVDLPGKTNAVSPAPAPAAAPASGTLTKTQYIEQYKPRIADVQASAPRYDEVDKPRDFPRPTCLASTDPRLLETAQSRGQKIGFHNGVGTVCQCYTQQSTRMATTFDFCMSVVENGYFDDTKQAPVYAQPNGLSTRKSDQREQADGLRRGPAAVGQRLATRAFNDPDVIPDSSYAERPWRRNDH